MHLFYCDNIVGKNLLLDEVESHHCAKVLRLTVGQKAHVTDGKGNLFLAEVEAAHPKNTKLVVRETLSKASPKTFYLHIAIAPTKNMERFEWFGEKATEIGMDEITPIICEKSERKEVKRDRLNKILLSAMKQSLNLQLPVLNEQVKFKEFIKIEFEGRKFIAHCRKENLPHLKNEYKKYEKALILIGAEGDFSEGEVNEALRNGFTEISLGKTRLRTETAGIIACHIVNLAND